jgi:predicted alpha/beta-hydrolase family hydrolase
MSMVMEPTLPEAVHHGTLLPVARTLRITWAAGEQVTGRLAMPRRARDLGVLLAPGAGAGQDHPFMTALRDGLAGAGFPTLTFDYPYREARRKAPDRLPKLLAAHRAAARRLAARCDRLVLAGKSMGGRVASHLAADGTAVAGLIFYGYPLVPLGKSEPRDTSHLGRIAAPMLFLAGSRDRLGPPDLIRAVAAGLDDATVAMVEGADHSFRLLTRFDPSKKGMTEELVEVSAWWLRGRFAAQVGGAR